MKSTGWSKPLADRFPPAGDGAAAGLIETLAFQRQGQVDFGTAPAGRLDHKVKMRPGPVAAVDGGEDPFAPVWFARSGAAAARDQFQCVGGTAQGNRGRYGGGDDGLTFRHE